MNKKKAIKIATASAIAASAFVAPAASQAAVNYAKLVKDTNAIQAKAYATYTASVKAGELLDAAEAKTLFNNAKAAYLKAATAIKKAPAKDRAAYKKSLDAAYNKSAKPVYTYYVAALALAEIAGPATKLQVAKTDDEKKALVATVSAKLTDSAIAAKIAAATPAKALFAQEIEQYEALVKAVNEQLASAIEITKVTTAVDEKTGVLTVDAEVKNFEGKEAVAKVYPAGDLAKTPVEFKATVKDGKVQFKAEKLPEGSHKVVVEAGTVKSAAADFTVKAPVVVTTVTPVAVDNTTLKLTLSNDVVDADLAAGNIKLSKGTVEAVTKTGAKEITVKVAGLKFGEEVKLSVGTYKIVDQAVKIPAISEVYVLELTTDATSDTIKSDGATKTQVTVTLKEKATGKVVDKDGIVQFSATKGGLGQVTSALQDGKATVQLTSIASATSVPSYVTATIASVPGSQEFEGLTGQKTVTFSPDATAGNNLTFVTPVYAESTQGDRLFVTFSNNISAAEYKKVVTASTWTGSKYGIKIDGQDVFVSDVVQKTDKTLEFILDTDDATTATAPQYDRVENGWVPTAKKQFLRDNVTHNVSFPANVGSVVLASATGVNFIMTDTSRPGVLGVTAKDQLEFSVRFTESVDERTVEFGDKAPNPNFVIDGRQVVVNSAPTAGDVLLAKAQNQIIVTSLTVGKYDTAATTVDTRNLVTFKVHKDFALAAGKHQVQVAKVTDWAGSIDPTQNTVETDTFDFTVVADTTKPVPTVKVQSAEQWLVSFDKMVSTVTNKVAYDVFKVATADATDTLEMDVDFHVYAVDATGVAGKRILKTDTISAEQRFLIEFTADWTAKYDTANNASKTYFASTKNPYKVTLDNVESLVGNKADKADLQVTLAYDGTSPTIASAVDVSTLPNKQFLLNTGVNSTAVTGGGQQVLVKLSEPIKVNNADVSNPEGLTASQQQQASGGVPVPTYEFVKGDKVVKATVVTNSLAADDQSFVLAPATPLEAGEWTLYIRSLSDDIGNTSSTVSQAVTVAATATTATTTQVAWAAFDDATGEGKLLAPGIENDNTKYDVVYVKFTKVMKADGANGVSRTQNYVFKGAALPIGSQVIKGIKGVTDNWDGVTILMPKDTWNGVGGSLVDFSTALNVASNFESVEGEKLSGKYEVELKDVVSAPAAAGPLDNIFEAKYSNTVTANFGNLGAIVTGAEATEAGDKDGKIDQIKLKLSDAVTFTTGTTIKVNGKTFTIAAGSVGVATKAPVFAATGDNQVDGTATSGLVITTADGAVLVGANSVVDKVAPVITKAVLNTSQDQITLTFSETVQTVAAKNDKGLDTDTFDVTNGTLTDGGVVTVSGNTVVYKVSGFTAGATINIKNTDQLTDTATTGVNDAGVLKVAAKVENIAGGATGVTTTGVAITSLTKVDNKDGVKEVAKKEAVIKFSTEKDAAGDSELSIALDNSDILNGYKVEFRNDVSAKAGEASNIVIASKVITVYGDLDNAAGDKGLDLAKLQTALITALKTSTDFKDNTTAKADLDNLKVTSKLVATSTALTSTGLITEAASQTYAADAGAKAVTGVKEAATFTVVKGASATADVKFKLAITKTDTTVETQELTFKLYAGQTPEAVALAIKTAIEGNGPLNLLIDVTTDGNGKVTLTQKTAGGDIKIEIVSYTF